MSKRVKAPSFTYNNYANLIHTLKYTGTCTVLESVLRYLSYDIITMSPKLAYLSFRERHQSWSTVIDKVHKHVVIRTTVDSQGGSQDSLGAWSEWLESFPFTDLSEKALSVHIPLNGLATASSTHVFTLKDLQKVLWRHILTGREGGREGGRDLWQYSHSLNPYMLFCLGFERKIQCQNSGKGNCSCSCAAIEQRIMVLGKGGHYASQR